MNRYIQLEGDRVTSTIVSPNLPLDTEKRTYMSVDGINPLPSRDWRYDSSSNTFSPPISYNLNHSSHLYEPTGEILFSGSVYDTYVTCSFNREINPILISDLSTGSLEVTEFNYDTTNNELTFKLSTGSVSFEEDPESIDFELQSIYFNSKAVDTKDWEWGLNPLRIIVTK